MEHSSTRSSSVSGVVSAILASSTVRAFRCAHFVAHLAVHHRLRPRFTTVTRSTAHDPHTPTLDRTPIARPVPGFTPTQDFVAASRDKNP